MLFLCTPHVFNSPVKGDSDRISISTWTTMLWRKSGTDLRLGHCHIDYGWPMRLQKCMAQYCTCISCSVWLCAKNCPRNYVIKKYDKMPLNALIGEKLVIWHECAAKLQRIAGKWSQSHHVVYEGVCRSRVNRMHRCRPADSATPLAKDPPVCYESHEAVAASCWKMVQPWPVKLSHTSLHT